MSIKLSDTKADPSDLVSQIIGDLQKLSKPDKAAFLQKYFKTGPGEYGEGDIFWGIRVPEQRKVAKQYYKEASFDIITQLLDSPIHEHRFTGTELLVFQYNAAKKAKDTSKQAEIVNYYLSHMYAFNNWDLIDNTANDILGDRLREHDKKVAYDLLKSKNIREVRAGIVCNLNWIGKHKSTEDSYRMATLMFAHPHQLIHKAVGWVLREAGKINPEELMLFLTNHWNQMPKIMRSYANEIVKLKTVKTLNKV